MKVQRLIELALGDIGVSNPSPDQYSSALDHLNMIISNFGFWNPDIQPIDKFLTIEESIELPAYYLETFELMLAAREALSHGLPMNVIQLLEVKVKQLTDRIVYRRVQNSGIGPSGMVI
jgi:hypothetical protein